MFNKTKYVKYYYHIINIARSQTRSKNDQIYYESHHIIPKCFGGSDEDHNLVLLTAREHFLCHWLLTKMVNNTFHKQKMLHAFSGMFNWKEKRSLSSRQFEIIKTAVSQRKQTQESNDKRSKTLKGRVSPMKGKISSRKGLSHEEFYGADKERLNKMKLNISAGAKRGAQKRIQAGIANNKKVCTDGIKTYNSIKEMADAHNVSYASMKYKMSKSHSPFKLGQGMLL